MLLRQTKTPHTALSMNRRRGLLEIPRAGTKTNWCLFPESLPDTYKVDTTAARGERVVLDGNPPASVCQTEDHHVHQHLLRTNRLAYAHIENP